jgi:hypothetical protein
MIEECPMTADCPGYDRDLQVCLVHPDDCEFSTAGGEATLTPDTPEVPTPDTSAGAASG